MLQLKKISAETYDEIKGFFHGGTNTLSCRTFGVMYLWDVNGRHRYAVHNGVLYFCEDTGETLNFTMFENSDIAEIVDTAVMEKKNLTFFGLSRERAKIVEDYFGENVKFYIRRESCEYVYAFEDLLNLSGKKYHGQRNHVNKFKKTYKNWKIKSYTSADRKSVNDFFDVYYQNNYKESLMFAYEEKAIKRLLDNYDELNFFGATLWVDDKVVGVTFAEKIGKMMFVHFEKADRDYEGSYATLNNAFCELNRDKGIKFVNREEDLGDEGLRTAKMRMHPYRIVDSYFSDGKAIIDEKVMIKRLKKSN